MDKQTLKDLEIFEAEDERKSLFDMLDLTLTTGGRMALRQRFQHPFNNVEDIQNTQGIVRFFLNNIDKWKLLIGEDEVRYVEKYMASNIIVFNVSGGLFDWLTAKEFQINSSDYFHFIESGVNTFHQFLIHLERFLKTHTADTIPEYLNDLMLKTNNLIAVLLEKMTFENTSHSALSILKADHLLRDQHKNEIEGLLNAFYEVDALFSMAKSCKKYQLYFPEIKKDNRTINIESLRHIFLPEGVANDFCQDNVNFIFLTGPNMSGKTTFLKALCITIFLAHTGMGIPALSAKIPLFDDIFTSINIEDSLHKKQSYFLSEVIRVKDMATLLHEGKKVFVVIDEMFRGTNLKDSIDCSLMVINQLVEWENSFFVLASHIAELGGLLPTDKVGFRYFESSVIDGTPVFSHKCKEGISAEHLGTLILQSTGIPVLLQRK